MKTENILSKWPYGAFKEIQRDKANFVQDSTNLRSLAIQNKEWFKEVFKYQSAWNIAEVQAILCPMYNDNGWLSTDSDYFEQVSWWLTGRIQKKIQLITDIIWFVQNYFELKVNFLIADNWLLLSENNRMDESEINKKIETSIGIFQKQIESIYSWSDFSISKMSDTDLDLERVRDMSFIPTIDDCKTLIMEKSIAPIALLRWLDRLIEMYGVTAAYYELDAYLKESKYFGDNYKNNIIINVEGSSLGNKKFLKWKDNMSLTRDNWNWWNLLIWAVMGK